MLLRILALKSDSPCTAPVLFWSSPALPLPVLCSWCLLSCSHICPTSAAAAVPTAMHESLVYTTSKTDLFCLFLTLTATISQKNTCKYLGTQMSCSRLLCVPLLPCFRGRLRCSRHLVPDRFAGSGATKGLLRPGPGSFLSFLP